MAEYSKDKLYFLKMPKDFFQSHEIRVLEGMDGGERYEIIYLKLMLESTSWNGYLRFSQEIAYTPKMIASLTNSDLDTVMVALKALESLGLVTTTAEGSIFIPKVQELTGITTEGAEKKRLQRSGQLADKRWTRGGQGVDKCPPEENPQLPLGSQDADEGGQMSPDCPPDIRYKSLDIRYKSLEDTPSKDSVSMSKQVKTSQKQKMLCKILVDSGFLDEEELQDPIWDDFLDGLVHEACDRWDNYWLNVKVRLQYVLNSHSKTRREEGPDGRPVFIKVFDHNGIANKYSWFEGAMLTAMERDVGNVEEAYSVEAVR